VAVSTGGLLAPSALLDRGQFTEVSRRDLSASTSATPREDSVLFEQAMAACFLIDEAYTLARSGPPAVTSGQEAIDTLVKLMETIREIAVIAAGYNRGDATVLRRQPGPGSRFSKTITSRTTRPTSWC